MNLISYVNVLSILQCIRFHSLIKTSSCNLSQHHRIKASFNQIVDSLNKYFFLIFKKRIKLAVILILRSGILIFYFILDNIEALLFDKTYIFRYISYSISNMLFLIKLIRLHLPVQFQLLTLFLISLEFWSNVKTL